MNTIRSGYRLFCKPWWKHWFSPSTYYYYVKYKWQRANRGWADCDVWSLDTYLVEWLPDAFRRLKATKHGVPMACIPNVFDETGNPTESALDAGSEEWGRILTTFIAGSEEWDRTLTTIIEGFEAYKRMSDSPTSYESEIGEWPDFELDTPCPEACVWLAREKPLIERDQKKFEEGVALFVKYFGSFWD